MNRIRELTAVVPEAPDFAVDWGTVESTVMRPYAAAMKHTRQNPRYHGEGDVWTHTKLVCEYLARDSAFRALETRKRQEVFLAALFHDVGKSKTTKEENGEWTSPHHAAAGAGIVRELLWREYGICGTKELQNFRETVCLLIRYHMTVPYMTESEDPGRRLVKAASNGELAPDFTIRLLLLLSRADSLGRISENNCSNEENVLFAEELARELSCLDSPVAFASGYSAFAYFSGKRISPGTELYDDTVSEVIMLCGLPGTGKDTWIRTVYPDYPMISLDEIRREFSVSPADRQQEVIRTAKSRAKQYLRAQQSFVWNATTLTPDIRAGLVSLFVCYRAYVKIVFLETDREENLKRNNSRPDAVPQAVIERMTAKLSPPERFEAHQVD